VIEENTVIDLFLEFEGRGMGMLRRRGNSGLFLEFEGRGMGMLRRRGNSGLLRDSRTGHLINAPVRESNHCDCYFRGDRLVANFGLKMDIWIAD